MEASYTDYVSSLAFRNPSLNILSDFLRHQPRKPSDSHVSFIEIEKTGSAGPPQESNTNQLMTRVDSGLNNRIIAVVENIHPDDIEVLGASLDIDPFFFCGHIASSYADIEHTPAPPLLALPPSQIVSKPFLNIHYQKVLDLGDESSVGHVPYKLALPANVPRNIRRLPALSGRSIGLRRACTSLIKKDLSSDVWICLILVDPAPDVVRPASSTSHVLHSKIPQIPRRIAVEDFRDLPTYAEFKGSNGSQNIQPLSPREEILSFFHDSSPGWNAGNPSILSLAYHPIQSVIREWILYGLLMGRYIKYYEYSFKSAPTRLEHFEKNDIIDLHRWRRRSLQSLHKLQTVRRFVEYWMPKEQTLYQHEVTPKVSSSSQELPSWNLLIADLKYSEEQIDQHARSLEALNPIITSLVQLIDSHKSISQAEDIRRLTYIAMACVPLSLIAGVFSMSEPYGPGNDQFWVYWVTALPTAAFIMGFLWLDSRIPDFLRFGFWAQMKKRVRVSSPV
ncbi:hypothetical protein P170DRAFT_510242 [Aspergillus steynii IBT 23096]|uniref:Uncharacterized protein n=1 Tax=Aspergillus steynii IBT 23096 TaxID=1392250 RepID=A0A2I2GA65_9EURO|nr:uncharacterized protein P170DRAFT_510242 [Aspergillus steynii IBT 23096]PLB49772.1 hypothetical protein P170DRAFT_510242 [Aspergillus steynii IBT 23096]